MNQEFSDREVCAVCGKDAEGDRWFCHFYGEHSRVTLCSPACAEIFLHRPAIPEINGEVRPVAVEASHPSEFTVA
jgi:hypothetical protein